MLVISDSPSVCWGFDSFYEVPGFRIAKPGETIQLNGKMFIATVGLLHSYEWGHPNDLEKMNILILIVF